MLDLDRLIVIPVQSALAISLLRGSDRWEGLKTPPFSVGYQCHFVSQIPSESRNLPNFAKMGVNVK